MWYQRLDERYNFSLGEALLPLVTSDDLKQMETPPTTFEINVKTEVDDINKGRLPRSSGDGK